MDWTGLDWIGGVKHGIELVKAKTSFLVLRILMVHIEDNLESGKLESVCLVDFKLTVVQSVHVLFLRSRELSVTLPDPSDTTIRKVEF